jgi:hypothetical protein
MKQQNSGLLRNYYQLSIPLLTIHYIIPNIIAHSFPALFKRESLFSSLFLVHMRLYKVHRAMWDSPCLDGTVPRNFHLCPCLHTRHTGSHGASVPIEAPERVTTCDSFQSLHATNSSGACAFRRGSQASVKGWCWAWSDLSATSNENSDANRKPKNGSWLRDFRLRWRVQPV